MTKKYYLKTFGCQMNTADSQKIKAVYEAQGYQEINDYKKADLVIINTCSVRQSAEDRVLGLVNNLRKIKIKNLKLKIIITGCMLRYPLAKLKTMLPQVDEFVKIKNLIKNLKLKIKNSKASAFVKIMEGCDNYCTYCVVPSSRGREVSRPMEEIYCEVKELVKRGVKEITLLGQNVNSYGKGLKKPIGRLRVNKKYENNFAVLLTLLHSIKGLEKIKFMTSNPQDLSEEIIEAMTMPKIDRYLHLALQSGDDYILKRMNRKYTVAQFIKLIKKLRQEIPGIEIGTDIIVGFPGETKEQFQNTVKLCKKINFKMAYINKYSPRWGTPAFKFKDNVTMQEKKRRWLILEKLINKKNHVKTKI